MPVKCSLFNKLYNEISTNLLSLCMELENRTKISIVYSVILYKWIFLNYCVQF